MKVGTAGLSLVQAWRTDFPSGQLLQFDVVELSFASQNVRVPPRTLYIYRNALVTWSSDAQ